MEFCLGNFGNVGGKWDNTITCFFNNFLLFNLKNTHTEKFIKYFGYQKTMPFIANLGEK